MVPPFFSDVHACVHATYGRGLSGCSDCIYIPTVGNDRFVPRILDRALNLAGTQASGADVDMRRSTVDQSFNTFDIGLEGAVGTDVRVRHGDAEGNALAAELALCHSDTS